MQQVSVPPHHSLAHPYYRLGRAPPCTADRPRVCYQGRQSPYRYHSDDRRPQSPFGHEPEVESAGPSSVSMSESPTPMSYSVTIRKSRSALYQSISHRLSGPHGSALARSVSHSTSPTLYAYRSHVVNRVGDFFIGHLHPFRRQGSCNDPVPYPFSPLRYPRRGLGQGEELPQLGRVDRVPHGPRGRYDLSQPLEQLSPEDIAARRPPLIYRQAP